MKDRNPISAGPGHAGVDEAEQRWAGYGHGTVTVHVLPAGVLVGVDVAAAVDVDTVEAAAVVIVAAAVVAVAADRVAAVGRDIVAVGRVHRHR